MDETTIPMVKQKQSQQTFTCSNSIIKILENGVKYVQSQRRSSGVFTVNFQHIPHIFLVFLLLLTLNM